MAMVGIFSEIETDLRKERQRIGIKRALAQGARFGRKSVITPKFRKEALSFREEGKSYNQIAHLLNSNKATVYKAINTVGKG